MSLRSMSLRGCLALGIAMSTPWLTVRPVTAQSPCRAPTEIAADLRASVEAEGRFSDVLMALVQRCGPHSRGELDALADSVVQVVLFYGNLEPPNAEVAGRGLSILLAAGQWGRWSDPPAGEPYGGLVERLVRIAEDTPLRASLYGPALMGLAYQPDREAALSHLRRIAASPSFTASPAVEALVSDMGSEGIDVLHELYRAGAVTNVTARRRLQGVAWARGWE